jgi:hypothetical protein
MLAFLVGGIAAGVLLLSQEALVGLPAEGIIGGLVFGYFIRKNCSIMRTVIASTIAVFLGFFMGAFAGLLIYDSYGVPALISGFMTGALFSLIMGFGKEFLRFAAISAAVFFLGDMILNSINVFEGPFFNLIVGSIGVMGYNVVIVSLTALYYGIAIGLGTGIHLAMDAKNAEAGEGA